MGSYAGAGVGNGTGSECGVEKMYRALGGGVGGGAGYGSLERFALAVHFMMIDFALRVVDGAFPAHSTWYIQGQAEAPRHLFYRITYRTFSIIHPGHLERKATGSCPPCPLGGPVSMCHRAQLTSRWSVLGPPEFLIITNAGTCLRSEPHAPPSRRLP